MVRAQRVGPLGHFRQELLGGDFGMVAPVTAKDQIHADHVVGIVAGADLIAVRARHHVDACLEPAILASDIEDHPENQTRFFLLARDGIPAATGHDKTSIACFQHADRPGSLLAILQEFAARAINLTKLESRPTKQGLGDYCFIIDLEGHVGDELVADCLRDLRSKLRDVKFLGSYPAAGEHGESRRRDADAAWREADAWISALRQRVRK